MNGRRGKLTLPLSSWPTPSTWTALPPNPSPPPSAKLYPYLFWFICKTLERYLCLEIVKTLLHVWSHKKLVISQSLVGFFPGYPWPELVQKKVRKHLNGGLRPGIQTLLLFLWYPAIILDPVLTFFPSWLVSTTDKSSPIWCRTTLRRGRWRWKWRSRRTANWAW